MRRPSRSSRELALSTGAPLALVTVGADGRVRLDWTNEAMARLLRVGASGARVALADLLDGRGARLTAAARELVQADAERATVQVGIGSGEPGDVVLDLVLDRRGLGERLRAVLRPGVVRRGVLHARPAEPADGGPTEDAGARARLAERLGVALPRLRRGSGRVVCAMVWISWPAEMGLRRPSEEETGQLAERVRAAARETDTVVQLGPGWLGLLAEDPADRGEIAMAQRLLAVLGRRAGDGTAPVVGVAVMEVVDPEADPEVVLGRLQSAGATARGGGLTVLDPWTGAAAAGPVSGAGPADPGQDRIEQALRSGRFVLGFRPVRPLSAPSPEAGLLGAQQDETAAPPVLMVEPATLDDDVLTPVHVSAAGLAVALDRWTLEQLATESPAGRRAFVRLQPGGVLPASLSRDVGRLLERRSGLELGLLVPEDVLDEAVRAQRAVLRELSSLGVALGVGAWSGQIDVRTLVRWQVEVVELSPVCQEGVLHPDGAALVTGLVAGVRTGLGPSSLVIAGAPREPAVGLALAACGVRWAFAARAGGPGRPDDRAEAWGLPVPGG